MTDFVHENKISETEAKVGKELLSKSCSQKVQNCNPATLVRVLTIRVWK
jgi:hypothetical protein